MYMYDVRTYTVRTYTVGTLYICSASLVAIAHPRGVASRIRKVLCKPTNHIRDMLYKPFAKATRLYIT